MAEIEAFLKLAIHTINKIDNPNANAGNGFFETPLTEVGKELDGTFGFLLDSKLPNIGNSESKPFNTINEITAVFNKSQTLYPPNQFSQLKLQNNVYIENPKAGDWLRFTTDQIEEGLINLKDKNKQDPKTTVKDLTVITQKFPIPK